MTRLGSDICDGGCRDACHTVYASISRSRGFRFFFNRARRCEDVFKGLNKMLDMLYPEKIMLKHTLTKRTLLNNPFQWSGESMSCL